MLCFADNHRSKLELLQAEATTYEAEATKPFDRPLITSVFSFSHAFLAPEWCSDDVSG
jgi:hypothetical protein